MTHPHQLAQRRSAVRAALLLGVSGWLALGFATASEDSSPRKDSRNEWTNFWSLRPIVTPRLPAVKQTTWPRNAIDGFILARLEQAGLSPSPEADRPTLMRRLSFDLLGLPPAPEEIHAFVTDSAPAAYERLVERLLALPQYGERWARHWLDVARFTESQGFEYDHMRPNAWHYRDYVINSLNLGKPYDVFVKEQIAGDTMKPVTSEQIIATSLLVCGPWDQAGNSQANITQRTITREEELEDLISVVGQTFLGLTVNCARCHAHKFDPIPQTDYYRLKAVFDGVRHGERTIATEEEVTAHKSRVKALRDRIVAGEKEVHQIEAGGFQRALGMKRESAVAVRPAPSPMALWTFERGAEDSLGSLHGTLHGGARIADGRLRLDGESAFVQTVPLTQDLSEKTLEVWVSLSNLEQRGGGAISVETLDGKEFDAIVFAERQPRKWTAGSSALKRTHDLNAPEETTGPGGLLHVAIAYRADNSIAVYRNGVPYGNPYTPAQPIQSYQAGRARVLFGKRHSGGNRAFLTGEIEQAALYDRALSSEEIAAVCAASGLYVAAEELLAALTNAERARREELVQQITKDRETLKAVPQLPVSYAGVRQQSEPTRVYLRGDVASPAEVVAAGALSAIPEPEPNFGLSPDAPESERRRKLAEWIVDPRNPLTARVMANRIWHYHFGTGIVATPNDLGRSGAQPSHPELLDWLAAIFMERGWSLKALHRLIVCSATYRQASAFNAGAARIDAENQLLWRFTPRRLEAEALRDAMLAVSGQLNWAQGGPGFRPFDTKSFNATFYLPVDKIGAEFNRRTVYRMSVNSGKDPLLDAFDCPDPWIKTPRRGATTTPLQALSLMNNSFVRRQAGHLAERVMQEAGGDPGEAIRRAYQHTLGRSPTDEEANRALNAAMETGMHNVSWALLNSTEFIYVR